MPKGIYQRKYRHAPNFKDLTGLRFGKRVVLSWNSSPIYRGKRGSSFWDVLCDCGKQSIISTSTLKSHSSCGCDLEYTKRSGKTRRNPVPEKIRNNHSHRRIFFKLSPEDFQKLIDKQNNKCKICDKVFVKTPHIDHDHSCCPSSKCCGKCIRGLLCHNCNCGLGNFHDDPNLLQRALSYIKGDIEV